MPTCPRNAWFLNEREKEVLFLRLAADREGGDKTVSSRSHLKEALLDPKAWMVFWFGVLVTMQSPVLTFASLVIESIGYSKLDTMIHGTTWGCPGRYAVDWNSSGLPGLSPANICRSGSHHPAVNWYHLPDEARCGR